MSYPGTPGDPPASAQPPLAGDYPSSTGRDGAVYPPDAATAGPGAPAALPPQHEVRRTRWGGLWVSTALFALVLLALLIFIVQNLQRASISYFGAHAHLPLGVALLLAAVFGVLLVVIPGTGRILQLRRTARRHERADDKLAGAAVARMDEPR